MQNSHGNHTLIDITGVKIEDPHEYGKNVSDICRSSLSLGTCREVHHKLIIFPKNGISPPGFTMVILIDESHITAHCYSEKGMLAIDIFTCGNGSDTNKMASFIIHSLKLIHPELVVRHLNSLKRFLH